MSTQRYSVTPHTIETILTWVKSGEIAIPEIQRPFVWEATKVRNLLDSLYHFSEFLEERRKLMALKTKTWFEVL
jgi:uncharacterized protein with ParB-like and HNH nuclease domain